MKKHLGLLVVCGGLLLSGGAFAQGHGHGHGNSSSQDDHGHGNSDHGDRDHGDRDSHYHSHRDYPSHVYVEHGRGRFHGMHDRGLHEGWYRRGGRIPVDYRSNTYVVTDWRDAHLRAPRRGYHWVRSDNGDFLMVAVATGIIAEILSH